MASQLANKFSFLRVNICTKACIHETEHEEWTLFLLLMHLTTSFLNMVPHLEYNPIQWKGKISADSGGTQTSYIPAFFSTGCMH